jgi:hypothetical protein
MALSVKPLAEGPREADCIRDGGALGSVIGDSKVVYRHVFLGQR